MKLADKLNLYEKLLVKWQAKINLISPQTLPEIRTRHFDDSAQLYDLIDNKTESILDLGSGAGFPGMILAMMGCENIHLAESDQRKCAFLREVSRETSTPVTIHHDRIENINISASYITARALAPIPKMLAWSFKNLKENGKYIFLKSESVEEELTDSSNHWYFQSRLLPSRTDSRGRIVILSSINPK